MYVRMYFYMKMQEAFDQRTNQASALANAWIWYRHATLKGFITAGIEYSGELHATEIYIYYPAQLKRKTS